MSVGQVHTLLRHVRRLAGVTGSDGLSDGQLLARFQADREESAFAALMRRHGRHVWSVCRHVLGNEQDAEDAFQATFLVLARKAGSIRSTEAVGSWLHGAAYRIAMRAKRDAAIRRKHESRIPGADASGSERRNAGGSVSSEVSLREGLAVLNEEVDRLAERHRAVFVACCLEGKTMAEAARELGWKEGTVSGTLARAKERLRSRLARRGVTLAAVLAALSLSDGATAALPPKLAVSTLHAALRYAAGGPAPATIAALIRGATRTMFLTKAKIATVLLVLIGAAAACGLASGLPTKDEPSAKPQAAEEKKNESFTVRGRVLDPDGKPAAGVSLHIPRLAKKEPRSPEDWSWTKKAATDANGRFEVTLKPSELEGQFRPYLVAIAGGYGLDWAELSKDKKPAELTLRLVKDAPIKGRVLDTQGKPITGVKVGVTGVMVAGKDDLDGYLTTWKNNWHEVWRAMPRPLYGYLDSLLRTTATDKDGRFTIRGVGVERVANVEVHGASIAKTALYVVTRPGFDPKPYNKAVLEDQRMRPGQVPTLYGLTFDYIAAPTRSIEGVIRDVDTGEPIAGASLFTGTGYNSQVSAKSDAQGQYRLTGLPKMDEYLVGAYPPNEKTSNLLPRTIPVPGPQGLGPIKQDIELAHGVVVTGRIIDKTTGKGVQGGVRFAPLPENKFFGKKPGYDGYRRDRTMRGSDAQGNFRIVIIPGPGVLMAQVYGASEKFDGQAVNPFRTAEFDAEDAKRVKVTTLDDGGRIYTAAGNSTEFMGLEGVVKVVDFGEKTKEATVNLYPERGKTLIVCVQDPDGKPLDGTVVSGMTELFPITFKLKKAECTIYALDGVRPRHVVFYHRERKLGGHVSVKGDEKEAVTVKLEPLGTVKGRLLDTDGQPLAGVEASLNMLSNTDRELIRYLNAQREAIHTDKDGRFRLDGVPPRLKFQLGLRKGRTYYMAEPKIGTKQLDAGKTLDLGDVRVKGTQF